MWGSYYLYLLDEERAFREIKKKPKTTLFQGLLLSNDLNNGVWSNATHILSSCRFCLSRKKALYLLSIYVTFLNTSIWDSCELENRSQIYLISSNCHISLCVLTMETKVTLPFLSVFSKTKTGNSMGKIKQFFITFLPKLESSIKDNQYFLFSPTVLLTLLKST